LHLVISILGGLMFLLKSFAFEMLKLKKNTRQLIIE